MVVRLVGELENLIIVIYPEDILSLEMV